ncbi:MAG: diguanylate cyclase [Candidatus Hydrothermae bacterium]|nr:diguanylate cyclase [Candidatus Hydrothermae bacterium]
MHPTERIPDGGQPAVGDVLERARALEVRLISGMSFVAAILLFYYGTQDLQEGSRWIWAVEYGMMLPSLALPLMIALRKDRFERPLRVLVVSGLALVFYLAIWDELPGDISSFFWVASIPPVAFLGLREGGIPFSMGFGVLFYGTAAYRYLLHGVALYHFQESFLSYWITTIALAMLVTILRWYREDWSHLAHTDPLTGAVNRLAFDVLLDPLLERASRERHPLSLVMFDLDDFKEINDTFGHGVGDQVLRQMVDWVQRALPPDATLIRWGGEEFVILVPRGLEEALALAERLRTLLAEREWPHLPRMTASFGVAAYRPGEGVDHWVSRADRALYRAKRDGKNCVRVDHDSG